MIRRNHCRLNWQNKKTSSDNFLKLGLFAAVEAGVWTWGLVPAHEAEADDDAREYGLELRRHGFSLYLCAKSASQNGQVEESDVW